MEYKDGIHAGCSFWHLENGATLGVPRSLSRHHRKTPLAKTPL